MNLDELQREILKVTKLGGMARVPEEMILASIEGTDPAQCRHEMEGWIADLCREYHLAWNPDQDRLGRTELLFSPLEAAR